MKKITLNEIDEKLNEIDNLIKELENEENRIRENMSISIAECFSA